MSEPSSLLAYVDPATGSLVIQAIIAGMVSLGYVFRKVLLSPFSLLFGNKSESTNKPPSA